MTDASEKVANILEECGFIDNLLASVDVNDKIRKLEQKARGNRPEKTKKTTPLTKFLNKEDANQLKELKLYKKDLKEIEDKQIKCTQSRLSHEKIVIYQGKEGMKGLFAEEPPFETMDSLVQRIRHEKEMERMERLEQERKRQLEIKIEKRSKDKTIRDLEKLLEKVSDKDKKPIQDLIKRREKEL